MMAIVTTLLHCSFFFLIKNKLECLARSSLKLIPQSEHGEWIQCHQT